MDATAKAHAGIQKLLQAEQDAAEIVAKAKQDKVARLKQAKAEADEEIAAYKVCTHAAHASRLGGYVRGIAEPRALARYFKRAATPSCGAVPSAPPRLLCRLCTPRSARPLLGHSCPHAGTA
jgi:hypothetical protein